MATDPRRGPSTNQSLLAGALVVGEASSSGSASAASSRKARGRVSSGGGASHAPRRSIPCRPRARARSRSRWRRASPAPCKARGEKTSTIGQISPRSKVILIDSLRIQRVERVARHGARRRARLAPLESVGPVDVEADHPRSEDDQHRSLADVGGAERHRDPACARGPRREVADDEIEPRSVLVDDVAAVDPPRPWASFSLGGGSG